MHTVPRYSRDDRLTDRLIDQRVHVYRTRFALEAYHDPVSVIFG